ncbi:MAG: hypothetical protein QM783_15880 [Phycisphaerales bacterium]
MSGLIASLEILERLRTGYEFASGPGVRAYRSARTFLGASQAQWRELQFLHNEVTHSLRSFVVAAHCISKNADRPPGERIDMIEKHATSRLESLCRQLATVMTKRTNAPVTVSICTVTDTHAIQSEPEFELEISDLEAKFRRKGASAEEARTLSLNELAEKAGGIGADLLPGGPKHALVVNRIRSGDTQQRIDSRASFWFIKSSTAHSYFEGVGDHAEEDAPIFITNEDITPQNHRHGPTARKPGNAHHTFQCPRKDYWHFYKSVAVLPLRAKADTYPLGYVGFLWLDSPKPKVFNSCISYRQGDRSSWSSSLCLLHAVADAVATIIFIEHVLCYELRHPPANPPLGSPSWEPPPPGPRGGNNHPPGAATGMPTINTRPVDVPKGSGTGEAAAL